MTNTPAQAISAAAKQSQSGPRSSVGMCLKMVRTCYDVGAKSLDAAGAWTAAEHKHKTSKATDIPAGAPVFWTGGSEHHGHIAISTGAGWCWSTDIKRPGYFDHVPIDQIRDDWGLTLVGWTNDLNGVTVYTPPTPPKPTKPVSRGANIDAAIKRLVAAEAANPHNDKTPHIKAALKSLRAITPR